MKRGILPTSERGGFLCPDYHELALTRMNNRNSQPNRKGFKPSIRRKRYRLQPNDSVKYIKSLCKVKGVILMGNMWS